MSRVIALWCEDCMERIPQNETHFDNVGDRYHIDTRTGNPHPVDEKYIDWDCACHISPPCNGCVENLWEENS